MTKRTFPADYGTRGCAVVLIDISLLPIVAAQLIELEEPRNWHIDSYDAGYQAIAQIEACMTSLCVNDLIESNNRIYRLLDTTLNGVYYTAEGDPPVISPPIPVVPETSYLEPGVLWRLDQTEQLLDNSLNGTETPMFSDPDGVKQKLQAIVDALGADDADIGTILSDLELILALLA